MAWTPSGLYLAKLLQEAKSNKAIGNELQKRSVEYDKIRQGVCLNLAEAIKELHIELTLIDLATVCAQLACIWSTRIERKVFTHLVLPHAETLWISDQSLPRGELIEPKTLAPAYCYDQVNWLVLLQYKIQAERYETWETGILVMVDPDGVKVAVPAGHYWHPSSRDNVCWSAWRYNNQEPFASALYYVLEQNGLI